MIFIQFVQLTILNLLVWIGDTQSIHLQVIAQRCHKLHTSVVLKFTSEKTEAIVVPQSSSFLHVWQKDHVESLARTAPKSSSLHPLHVAAAPLREACTKLNQRIHCTSCKLCREVYIYSTLQCIPHNEVGTPCTVYTVDLLFWLSFYKLRRKARHILQ